MGFNFSAVIIDRSYEHQVEALERDLKIHLSNPEEVSLEKASANWTEENVAYIYTKEQTTMVFMSMERCSHDYPIAGQTSLAFCLSEMTMAFSLSYSQDGVLKRELVEYNGDIKASKGEPLPFENHCEDTSEIIWHAIDHLLGYSYSQLDLADKAIKYTIVKASEKKPPEPSLKKAPANPEPITKQPIPAKANPSEEVLKTGEKLALHFSILLVLSFGTLIYGWIKEDGITRSIMHLLMTGALMFAVYQGKNWARIALCLFLAISILFGLPGAFQSTGTLFFIKLAIICYTTYLLYLLNTPEVKAFQANQNGEEFTPSRTPDPIKTAPQQKQNSFLTNSEDFGFGHIELGIAGKLRVDAILAISKFQDKAKMMNEPFSYSVMYTTLLEEGALTVPLVFSIGEKRYSTYFIYQENDLLKYLDLQQHVERTHYPHLIYFSSIPVSKGYSKKPIIEPFQLADLRIVKDGKLTGDYAMWWRTENDIRFSSSKTGQTLKKLYEIYEGYETYLLGYLIRQIRVNESTELKRVRLPESIISYVVAGPEDKKILIDVSQEKGIRFLFPIKETTTEYRERFLHGVMIDFLATRYSLHKNDAQKDPAHDPNSYNWFSFMLNMIEQKENEGEKIDLVGVFKPD